MTPECFASHMGAWAVEPTWFSAALAAIKAGLWRPPPPAPATGQALASARAQAGGAGKPYAMADGRVALVPLVGVLGKAAGKMIGTGTVAARNAIRAAQRDPDVGGIMLLVDSPGGAVAGTAELADDVAAARRRMPVHAFIDDLGASAAYWIASQAARVSANRMAQVGSIGAVLIVQDESQAMEIQGVKVHVIRSGPFKGAGAPGAPVLPEHLEQWQGTVDAFAREFHEAVRRGRHLSEAQLARVVDGRTWVGAGAQDLRLVDAIESWDQALAALREAVAARDEAARARRGLQCRLRLAELDAQAQALGGSPPPPPARPGR